ncbi:substrate-binding domain-containing protein [Streptosporangium roseum]|uniref:substrate-binding domain-containing protein n=1 Tax=Streptosporangium roseum TaxID=2001 RepID=UPI00068C97A4|nr:substrate-binding domain-containing protein [Streptosporangium roseum]
MREPGRGEAPLGSPPEQAKEVGPSDASSQVSYINTLIQQQQDAILIAANDANAVCGPLKQAMSKGVKIVAYGDDDQKSFQETQGLLQAYPDLKGIISPTAVGISAAARHISGSKDKGKITLTGLGTPNQMREFVKDGTVQQFALWNPKDLGYLAGYSAAAPASGQITGAEGEKFKAGKLGEYTIGKDGEVILGAPFVFTADNIDEFDF